MSGSGGWQRHGRFSDTIASVSCGEAGLACDIATKRQPIIGNSSILSYRIQISGERGDKTKGIVAKLKPESVSSKFRESNSRVKLLPSKRD